MKNLIFACVLLVSFMRYLNAQSIENISIQVDENTPVWIAYYKYGYWFIEYDTLRYNISIGTSFVNKPFYDYQKNGVERFCTKYNIDVKLYNLYIDSIQSLLWNKLYILNQDKKICNLPLYNNIDKPITIYKKNDIILLYDTFYLNNTRYYHLYAYGSDNNAPLGRVIIERDYISNFDSIYYLEKYPYNDIIALFNDSLLTIFVNPKQSYFIEIYNDKFSVREGQFIANYCGIQYPHNMGYTNFVDTLLNTDNVVMISHYANLYDFGKTIEEIPQYYIIDKPINQQGKPEYQYLKYKNNDE